MLSSFRRHRDKLARMGILQIFREIFSSLRKITPVSYYRYTETYMFNINMNSNVRVLISISSLFCFHF